MVTVTKAHGQQGRDTQAKAQGKAEQMANKGSGSGALKSKHVPVYVAAETHQSMKTYSEVFGTPINQIAARAIELFMATTGKAEMEVMLAHRQSAQYANVLVMPAPGAEQAEPAQAD